MKRRNFLSLIGVASLAPALPAMSLPSAAATAGYNRYMYGLAVFHARTRAGLTTVELMTRLRISSTQANAMIGEMETRGVFSPLTSAVRAAAPPKPDLRKMLRHLQGQPETAAPDRPITDVKTPSDPDPEIGAT